MEEMRDGLQDRANQTRYFTSENVTVSPSRPAQ